MTAQTETLDGAILPPELDSSGFVELTDLAPDVVLELRYFSTYNFTGERVRGYLEPAALLSIKATEALKRVSDKAMALGYRLKIYDAYRPQMAVDQFAEWADAEGGERMKRFFYPDLGKHELFDLGFIARKSSHSRGSAVDLTLLDMSTGRDVDMGGVFDFFGARSYSDYTGDLNDAQIANRALLRKLMVDGGFLPLECEWWHFMLADEPYPDTYFNFPVSVLNVVDRWNG